MIHKPRAIHVARMRTLVFEGLAPHVALHATDARRPAVIRGVKSRRLLLNLGLTRQLPIVIC